MLPKIESYGQYSSSNYGLNTRILNTAGIKIFYSYETPVAYSDAQDGLVVCQNQWGTTTGKHLNWIDGGDKKNRLPYSDFSEKLAAAVARHGL